MVDVPDDWRFVDAEGDISDIAALKDEGEKVLVDEEVVGSFAADGALPPLDGDVGVEGGLDEVEHVEGLVVGTALQSSGWVDDATLEVLAFHGDGHALHLQFTVLHVQVFVECRPRCLRPQSLLKVESFQLQRGQWRRSDDNQHMVFLLFYSSPIVHSVAFLDCQDVQLGKPELVYAYLLVRTTLQGRVGWQCSEISQFSIRKVNIAVFRKGQFKSIFVAEAAASNFQVFMRVFFSELREKLDIMKHFLSFCTTQVSKEEYLFGWFEWNTAKQETKGAFKMSIRIPFPKTLRVAKSSAFKANLIHGSTRCRSTHAVILLQIFMPDIGYLFAFRGGAKDTLADGFEIVLQFACDGDCEGFKEFVDHESSCGEWIFEVGKAANFISQKFSDKLLRFFREEEGAVLINVSGHVEDIFLRFVCNFEGLRYE